MTDRAPLRKVIFLCGALAASSLLGACNDPDLAKTFADIKAIKVDDSGSASPGDKHLKVSDVELAVNTAKDVTVNSGGLFDGDTSGGAPKFEIAVIEDPLDMPRPDADTPLDERIAGAPGYPSSTVMDIPLPASRAKPAAPVPQAVQAAATGARYIQVGSFGSPESARSAWSGLIGRYPGIDRYNPSYQAVTTAAGKTLVRLKVGPVTDERHAKSLCAQIDIQDAWCSKAG